MTGPRADEEAIRELREDFRRRLEEFYAKLQLAPPYDSVERAIVRLMTTLRTLPPEERGRVREDEPRRWDLYRIAFEQSGLSRKHRGIIAGMARQRERLDLPNEYDVFLSLFRS